MQNLMDDLYDMKEAVAYEIGEANKRIQQAGNKISTTDLDIINKLTHSLKSLTTVCAMLEAEEEKDDGYSMNGQTYREAYRGGSNRGGSYRGYAGENRNRYSRNSYAREGRGYSRTGDMTEHLRMLMDEAPDENTRMEIRKLMDRFER